MNNISPGIIGMYAALAWTALSIPAGILTGRALRNADTPARCYCGTCSR